MVEVAKIIVRGLVTRDLIEAVGIVVVFGSLIFETRNLSLIAQLFP